jgi:hypothetical protein
MYCARTIVELEKQVRGREYRSEGRSKEEETTGLLSDILAERTVQVSNSWIILGMVLMMTAEDHFCWEASERRAEDGTRRAHRRTSL